MIAARQVSHGTEGAREREEEAVRSLATALKHIASSPPPPLPVRDVSTSDPQDNTCQHAHIIQTGNERLLFWMLGTHPTVIAVGLVRG